MQLHTLSNHNKKTKKRVGRGGKRGTYSGRGMKGQKARSGGNVDPLFQGGRSSLIMQMKKNRGFRSPHPRKTAVSLDTLDRSYADGETVSVQSLQEKGILTKKNAAFGAKVLSTGKLSKKLTIAPEIRVSAGAKTAIENAGGRIEEVPQEETASNQ